MKATTSQPGQAYAEVEGKWVIHAGFLLLFPGFFLYQTLLGIGVIRAYLGGYFSVMAFALMPPLVWYYFVATRKVRNYFFKTDLYFLLFAAYYAAVLATNFAVGTNHGLAQKYVASLVFCVDVYIIFRMLDLSDRLFVAAATTSLLLMSGITLYFSIDGFFYLKNLDEASNPESLATYQGFARSYIYTFLIVVSTIKTIGVRFLLYVLATVTLFVNGARSEFSAVLFVIPIIELYHAKNKLYSITMAFFLAIWVGANFDEILRVLPDSRILQLFDMSHSSSSAAREQLSLDAWRTILQNPIFGDFGSYADGHYAHNILCAWVDFGLIGFVYLAMLLAWPAVRMATNGFFATAKSAEFVLAFAFSCIGILWALTAKAVPDMSIGAALGAFAQYRYRAKCDRSGVVSTDRLS